MIHCCDIKLKLIMILTFFRFQLEKIKKIGYSLFLRFINQGHIIYQWTTEIQFWEKHSQNPYLLSILNRFVTFVLGDIQSQYTRLFEMVIHYFLTKMLYFKCKCSATTQKQQNLSNYQAFDPFWNFNSPFGWKFYHFNWVLEIF